MISVDILRTGVSTPSSMRSSVGISEGDSMASDPRLMIIASVILIVSDVIIVVYVVVVVVSMRVIMVNGSGLSSITRASMI